MRQQQGKTGSGDSTLRSWQSRGYIACDEVSGRYCKTESYKRKFAGKSEKSAAAMIEIQNTQACFVQLWRKLERSRQLLSGQCKRFCVRRVLKTWFGQEATDDFI
jgi:hypothetical protein